MTDPVQTFTAFCQQADGCGTIWIDTVEAATVDLARDEVRAACAADWGYPPADVHVLGLARGNVEIVDWQDLYE